jgi:hypothetical protein
MPPADRTPENEGMFESEGEAKNGDENEIHEHVAVKLLDALDVVDRIFLVGCYR